MKQENKQKESLSIDAIKLSAEGKRQAIIDKVASDIVSRISRFGIHEPDEDEAENVDKINTKTHIQQPYNSGNLFVFNTIDRNNQKTTRSFSAKDPSVMIAQFEKLAKKSAGNSRDR